MQNYIPGPNIPLGLSMALAQDLNAMQHFATLPQNERQAIIERAHEVRSKSEMRKLVQSIS